MNKSIFKKAFGLLNVFRNDYINQIYWNLRAKDIDEQWGESRKDYEILSKIIKEIKADKILDIGCGSGRLFSLYSELNISEVVAQDVSNHALDLARSRAMNLKLTQISFLQTEISELNFPDSYFDLVISARTLSAVFPNKISATVEHLSKISKNIYIDEMTTYEPSAYWFKHDYIRLFEQNQFIISQSKLFYEKQVAKK